MFLLCLPLLQQGRVVFAPQERVGLFFSIFPDASTATRVAHIAEHLRAKYRLRGSPLQTMRFHASLYCFGEYDNAPPPVVARAKDAAALVNAAPFRVSFNCARSFFGRDGNLLWF
jgi:2'-5' RNA ligase